MLVYRHAFLHIFWASTLAHLSSAVEGSFLNLLSEAHLLRLAAIMPWRTILQPIATNIYDEWPAQLLLWFFVVAYSRDWIAGFIMLM